MKHCYSLLAACMTLALLSGCAGMQNLSSSLKQSGDRLAKVDNESAAGDAAVEFLEGVVIDPGNQNSLSLKKQRSIYDNRSSGSGSSRLEDQKIDLNSVAARSNPVLYHFIEEWYGVPYRLGGESKAGVDCSAFVKRLFEEVYGQHLLRTAAQQYATSVPIIRTELREGDLVFFKIRSRRISHVGVYLQDGEFVHASLSRGVMISKLDNPYWTRYFAGAGRVTRG